MRLLCVFWDIDQEPGLESWDYQAGWRPGSSSWIALPLPWAIPEECPKMNLSASPFYALI